MRPWIGVTIHVDDGNAEDLYPNHPLHYVERDYINTLLDYGMNPLILPYTKNNEVLVQYMDKIDGLLMTGGGFLDLKKSPETLSTHFKNDRAERFDYESRVLKAAVDLDMPILGICRGYQVINEYFGGSLKNLGTVYRNHHQEIDDIHGGVPTHSIELDPGSKWRTILGKETIEVNSFHRQAIDILGQGLGAVGWSSDDRVIEVIEGTMHRWLLGCQFHPEKLLKNDPDWGRLFTAFKHAAYS